VGILQRMALKFNDFSLTGALIQEWLTLFYVELINEVGQFNKI